MKRTIHCVSKNDTDVASTNFGKFFVDYKIILLGTVCKYYKSQPHQTWHGDRGGGVEKKTTPAWLNPYNFVTPWPNSTKFLTPIRESTPHTSWKFCRYWARKMPLWGIYIPKFRKIVSFGGLCKICRNQCNKSSLRGEKKLILGPWVIAIPPLALRAGSKNHFKCQSTWAKNNVILDFVQMHLCIRCIIIIYSNFRPQFAYSLYSFFTAIRSHQLWQNSQKMRFCAWCAFWVIE